MRRCLETSPQPDQSRDRQRADRMHGIGRYENCAWYENFGWYENPFSYPPVQQTMAERARRRPAQTPRMPDARSDRR